MSETADLTELYSNRILRWAGNVGRAGRLPAPMASAKKRSLLCGSEVRVDLRVEEGRVSDFAQEVKACALGQAAAGIMAERVVGATAEELRAVRAAMRAMLKDGAPAPAGEWAELEILEAVRDYPARHASVMLVFDAVVDCLDQIEAAGA